MMERASGIAYWTGAAVLMLFGFIAIFSIGAPFLLTGAAMILVGPFRHRPRVLWPALAAVWSFVVAYVLVAPLGCTTSSNAVLGSAAAATVGRTVCTNVLGIDYSGGVRYQPTLGPAFVIALIAAAVVGLVMRRVLRPRAPAAST
jgi:hypothetical protein